METRGSIRLHYGADPQLRAPDSGLRSTGRGAPEHRLCTVKSHANSLPCLPDPWLRSGLIADAPSPGQNRRLELPFSFEVAAA